MAVYLVFHFFFGWIPVPCSLIIFPKNFKLTSKRAPNADYGQRMETLRADVLSGKAVLVIFDTIVKYDTYPTVEEISEGLYLWVDTKDGAVYSAPDWASHCMEESGD